MTEDGCGHPLDCNACPSTQTCGGDGVPNVCGGCVVQTCEQLNAACGRVNAGCGTTIQCGPCSQPEQCGGAGVPNQCGVPSSCTNLCLAQRTCSTPGVTTTISGTVYAPNGADPLFNALVYIPNSTVEPITSGVSCDRCSGTVSGDPLVRTTTGVDGKFTLRNVPVGLSIPVVIQLGKWRRQLTVAEVLPCQDNRLPASLTRLPRNRNEGHIPLIAVATGAVDAVECVFSKMGVQDMEFTTPAGGGRIHLYQGLTDHNSKNHTASLWASGGAKLVGSPLEDQLWSTLAQLKRYDMVLFPCQADEASPSLRSAAVHQNLVDYANAGGRVLATHFSYIWLNQTPPFNNTAAWNVNQNPAPVDQTGFIDTSFPRGMAMAQWLQTVNASTTLGQIPLQVLRHDFDGVVPPSQTWLSVQDPAVNNAPLAFTFNTPVGQLPAQQCGRVLFNDFHVEDVPFETTFGAIFPGECVPGAMTPQEKLLEFMLFDLSSCITADQPACSPVSCESQGHGCGPSGNGCGQPLDCMSCPGGETCGGGGNFVCGNTQSCLPYSCEELGFNCGPTGDGCGGALDCGTCATPHTCGGGGVPGVCGGSGHM